jgi:hypothetical protein
VPRARHRPWQLVEHSGPESGCKDGCRNASRQPGSSPKAYAPHVHVHFEWEGSSGEVIIDCVPNGDPVALGCPPESADYPACTASVRFPPVGYRGLLGWVQLVRSTDNASEGERFEMDPLLLFFDAPSPTAGTARPRRCLMPPSGEETSLCVGSLTASSRRRHLKKRCEL